MEALIVGLAAGLCALVSFCWGGTEGREIGQQEIKDEAIDKGFAHYDPKTGEFTWNEK